MASRTSARISEKAAKQAEQAPKAPKAKKGESQAGGAKGGDKAKKPRKGKGKAQEEVVNGRDLFSSLPLDLLLDICHDLSPADLLAISQTSKGVHATFFAKSAAPLWLAARRAVGMPDLEADDMSETRYAFLVCGTTTKNTQVDHSVRVRACYKCLQAVLRTEAYIRDKHSDVHDQAFECALQTAYSAAGETRKDEARAFHPPSASSPPAYHLSFPAYFYVPDVLAVSKNLISLETAALEAKAGEVKAGNPLEVYVQERKQHKKKVELDAVTIFAFESRSLDDSLKVDDEKRKERRTAIDKKLAEIGASEDERSTLPWLYRTVYDSTRTLTDQEWDQIRPTLVVGLAKLRADRAERAAIRALQLYHSDARCSLPAKQQVAFLPFADFLRLPSVEPLWSAINPSVTPTKWQAVKEAAKREALAVMKQNKLDLFKLLASQLLEDGSPLPDSVKEALKDEAAFEHLDDATMDPIFARVMALFSCAVCHEKYPFPTIYRHVVDRHATYDSKTPNTPEVDYLLPHNNFRSALLAMLRKENLNESTTTTADLEALGDRFRVSGRTPLWKTKWAFLTRNVYELPRWSWYSYDRRRYRRPQMPAEDSIYAIELIPLPAPPQPKPAPAPAAAQPAQLAPFPTVQSFGMSGGANY